MVEENVSVHEKGIVVKMRYLEEALADGEITREAIERVGKTASDQYDLAKLSGDVLASIEPYEWWQACHRFLKTL